MVMQGICLGTNFCTLNNVVCAATSECQLPGTCIPLNGTCVTNTKPVGTPCQGSSLTVNNQCQPDGSCVGL